MNNVSVNNSYSVLKTSTVKIGKKYATVQQLHGRKDRQDIAYRINGGNVLTTDEFYSKKPQFVN